MKWENSQKLKGMEHAGCAFHFIAVLIQLFIARVERMNPFPWQTLALQELVKADRFAHCEKNKSLVIVLHLTSVQRYNDEARCSSYWTWSGVWYCMVPGRGSRFNNECTWPTFKHQAKNTGSLKVLNNQNKVSNQYKAKNCHEDLLVKDFNAWKGIVKLNLRLQMVRVRDPGSIINAPGPLSGTNPREQVHLRFQIIETN